MRIVRVISYRLLGPLSVERDGQPLDLGPRQQRAVLAALVQDAGATVSTDRLVLVVWGDDPPTSAVASIQAHISRLRRLLRRSPSSPSPIQRRAHGYVLEVTTDQVDLPAFLSAAQAARQAVAARDWAAAVAAGEEALSWWHGTYLADFADEEWVQVAAVPLLERRAGVVQDLVVGLLGRGDLTDATARSSAMLAEQPLVERAAWLHMVALHRSGRTGEALAAYRRYAGVLDDELGLDVGPAMRDLQGAILRQDPSIGAWPGAAAGPADQAVPGVVEPASRPTPAAALADGTDTADDPRTRLVGRRDEWAAIEEVLQQARSGGTGWLVLTGAAGMGKSRLAQEAAQHWARTGGRIVQGSCPDDAAVPAWWPVKQLLRGLGADPEAVLTPAAGSDADAARFAAMERARDVLLEAARVEPLLVLVEDVHWADRTSLRFLTFVAESMASADRLLTGARPSAPEEPAALALVITSRDHTTPEVDRLLAAVARRPGSRQLPVPPLSRPEIGELAAQVSGARLPPADLAALAERTAGNPFFVGEYARLDAAERERNAIPTAVRAVLRRRLADLSPDLVDVLRAAAVLGDPLEVDLLGRMTDRSPDDVADRLDEASDRAILVPTPDGASYAFAHALLQDEVQAGLPTLRRQRLELQAAAAFGTGRGDDVLRRAAHLRAAGASAGPALLLEATRAAAVEAERQGQPDVAATWWATAVSAFDRLPDGAADVRDELVGAQVAALTRAGRGQAVLDVLDGALLDAVRAGRTSSVGRLAANLLRVSGSWPWPAYGSDPAPLLTTLRGLDTILASDPGARARVLAVTAIGHCYDLDHDVPDTMSRRAVELAEEAGDPDVLADTLLGRALTFSGVARHAAESLAILDRLVRLPHRDQAVDEVLAHNLATCACVNLARIEEAVRHLEAGVLGADVLRMPVDRVQLRWAEACIAQWRGDLPRAQELYARAEAAHRQTELQQTGTFELAEVVLCWERGRLAEIDGRVPTNPVVSRWTTVVADAAAGRAGADDAIRQEVHRPEPVAWTSHGRLALLAHAAADRGLSDLVDPLLVQLRPLEGYLATIGHVGTIGPVGLAIARLLDLYGDRAGARAQLERAQSLAAGSGGASAELHGRLVAARWAVEEDPASTGLPQELDDLEAGLARRGMTGLVAQVVELRGRLTSP